jgi:hypothetical protein
MYIDDAPKLRRQILKNAGALVPGRKTYWSWTGVADATPIAITGADGAVVIESPKSVRVVITKRGMVCPHCGAGCYMLLHNGESWGCRLCCGLKYRTRSGPHPTITLRSVLRWLARADAGSLRERRLKNKLERLNTTIEKQAKNVGFRCTYPRR